MKPNPNSLLDFVKNKPKSPSKQSKPQQQQQQQQSSKQQPSKQQPKEEIIGFIFQNRFLQKTKKFIVILELDQEILENYIQEATQIVGSEFNRKQIIESLKKNNFNVEAAVAYLYDNQQNVTGFSQKNLMQKKLIFF